MALHPTQQTQVVWAVCCLPLLEKGNCAQVRFFFKMPVVVPECPPSSPPMHIVAILVGKPHKVKYGLLLISFLVSNSKASYLTAGNLKWVSSCHTLLSSLSHHVKAAVKCFNIKHETWQTCYLNHSFNFVSFPGSDYRRALQIWLGEAAPTSTWTQSKMPTLCFPAHEHERKCRQV